MKRRILALLLAGCMSAGLLTACGNNSSETTTPDTSAPETTSAETPAAETGAAETPAAQTAVTSVENPNLGKGMYAGTSEAGAITVECSTLSTMSTIKMTYATELAIARHCYDALVKLDDTNTVYGAAAESWESSEDGMTWTFHLREGAKWVDSTGAVVGDVTANDFVFAWSELLNPDNAAEYYNFATIFKNAQAYYDYASGAEGAAEVTLEDVGFRAIDDYTLEIELETYLPYFLQYMKFEVMSPVYQPFYEEVGADNYGTAPEYMVYNGAFYLTDWVTESSVTVEKNNEWYDASNVSLEKINFVKYTDNNTKYNAFLSGELDLMDCTGENRTAFESEGYDVSSFIGGYSYFFYTNTTEDSDFRSVNLRKAVSAAIDRQQLITTVFKNDNQVPDCFSLGISGVNTPSFSDAVVAANGGSGLYASTSDPEAAQEYLAAALTDLGYTDASQINISLMTSEGTQNELVSQVIQESLRTNLGLDVSIEVLSITDARARRNALDFDFFLGGWGPDYDDPMTDLELWTSDNGNNHTGYASAEYDALIEATKSELDPEAREQMFVQAEQMLYEDMPIIPLYWRHEDYVTSEKLTGGYLRLPFQYYNLIYTTLAD